MAQVKQRAYTLHYVANLVGCKLKVDAAVAPALAFGARGPSQARLADKLRVNAGNVGRPFERAFLHGIERVGPHGADGVGGAVFQRYLERAGKCRVDGIEYRGGRPVAAALIKQRAGVEARALADLGALHGAGCADDLFAACAVLPVVAAAVPMTMSGECDTQCAKGNAAAAGRACREDDGAVRAAVAVPEQVKHMLRMASGLGLCGLLVSFANAFADGAARAMALSATRQYFDNLGHAAGLVAAVFVDLCLRFLTDGIAAAYRVVMLVMAAFLVFSPIFGQMGPLAVFVALLQQGAFNILFFVIVARAMAARRADATGLFCVSWGMMTAGQLAGWAVAGLFGALLFAMPNAGVAVALVSVALVSVTYMFALPGAKLSELIAGEGRAAQCAGDIGRSGGFASSEPGGHKRAFQEKCQVVAREFGLTEREAEVMVLLAKGRTRARIQEELYLSSGTVATHARHIYQKVGVHSKQELLDVIESAGERPARKTEGTPRSLRAMDICMQARGRALRVRMTRDKSARLKGLSNSY